MRKILLLGLVAVAVGLLAIGLVPRFGIVKVSATTWTVSTSSMAVTIGDFNNDGSNDIAFTQEGYGDAKAFVYKSDGTTVITQWTTLWHPGGVAIGDYNNDGLNDIAIEESWGGAQRVTVYKSDGITIIKQWTGLNGPSAVAIGDYDNDGLNDLAFAEYNNLRVTVYKNDGVTIIKQWTALGNPQGVAIGDYDNDGLNDLAFTEVVGKLTVYKSDGTTIIKQWTGLNGPRGVAIGDYNNDGLNDIAFVESWTNSVTVYYQTKPGTVARVAEPTIVTLRGTLTDDTGYPIQSGSIRVTIKDSMGIQVWQDIFNNVIDNGKYNIPLGTKTTLMLIKGQIYNAILEVDADSPTFISADVTYGDNNPSGDIIKFVAN